MQLKHAGGDAISEASKDRPVLQANKAHLQKMKHITKTLGFLESHIIKNKGPYGTGPTPTLILQSTACCSASTRRVFEEVKEHPKVIVWDTMHSQ
ncbi:hypothetical protein PF004_g13531 [Phytophthora fragariae]|uniref:Uncharacterized protein n=1 Tax=Phytophthora fragariae TaxID=53985 RepID=A0A6G0NS05_9STRA|nr:hypothetical protein PF004_g13531 [Phytophthora fragariae]